MVASATAILVGQASAVSSALPGISVEDVASPEEGPEGVDHAVAVPIRLSFPSAEVVTVNWTTVDGTAQEADYYPGSGTVRFEPGDTSEFVEVVIDGGITPEWNEYFTVFLSSPTNGIIERAIAKVTIINDDGDPPGLAPGEGNVAPAGGVGQCVALDNGQGCQPLEVGQQMDFDSISYINPRAGRVELRTSEGVSTFYGGKFDVDQIAQSESVSKSIVVVKLVGGTFKGCEASSRRLAGAGEHAAAMAKKPIRRLWGKGKGRFRTRGQYSSGTVRGTNWLTEDFCDGTRTRVVSGVVRVYDLVTKRWVVLTAGESYFAKAKKEG